MHIPIAINDNVVVQVASRMMDTYIDIMLLVIDTGGMLRQIYNRVKAVGYPAYTGGAASQQIVAFAPGVEGHIIDARAQIANIDAAYPAAGNLFGQLGVGVLVSLVQRGVVESSPSYRLLAGTLVSGSVLLADQQAPDTRATVWAQQPIPAAGAPFDFYLADVDEVELVALRCTLAAAAGGATRRPWVAWLDGGGAIIAQVNPAESQAGGTTLTYQYAQGLVARTTAVAASQSEMGLPPIRHANNNRSAVAARIRIGVDNILPADQLSNIWMLWRHSYGMANGPV